MLSKLAKADFHGCKMTGTLSYLQMYCTYIHYYDRCSFYSKCTRFLFPVSKSKCPHYVGLTGIIIMETQNTFKVITKENTIKGPQRDGHSL